VTITGRDFRDGPGQDRDPSTFLRRAQPSITPRRVFGAARMVRLVAAATRPLIGDERPVREAADDAEHPGEIVAGGRMNGGHRRPPI
jgi:hypothetical protein